MRVLLITTYFPPAGGGGVARPLKLATHLSELGFETHVLAPDDTTWIARDEELEIPPQVRVHRARYVGPRGRLPGEELHGLSGAGRADRPRGWRRCRRHDVTAALGQPDRGRGQAGDRSPLGRRPARLDRGES